MAREAKSPTIYQHAHYYSGLLLATFLVMHLTNHMLAWGGAEMHIRVMKYLRLIYRWPPVEMLLLGAVLLQIITGFSLVLRKGLRRRPWTEIIQISSGLYLAFFLVNHVRAVLMARYEWGIETDFYFASGVARAYPSQLFFIPYYAFSVLAVFLHIACAHYNRRQETSHFAHHRVERHKQEAILMAALGVVVAAVIMYPLVFV